MRTPLRTPLPLLAHGNASDIDLANAGRWNARNIYFWAIPGVCFDPLESSGWANANGNGFWAHWAKVSAARK
jgi:hypothetical protein